MKVNLEQCLPGDIINRWVEPSKNAKTARDLLDKSSQFAGRDGVCAYARALEYCSIAWVVSTFDTVSFGTKLLSDMTVSVVEWNLSQLLLQLQENSTELLHSVKLNIVLPFILFAGLFLPKVFEMLHYSQILDPNRRELIVEQTRREVLSNLREENLPRHIQQRILEYQMAETQYLSELTTNRELINEKETAIQNLEQELIQLNNTLQSSRAEMQSLNQRLSQTTQGFQLRQVELEFDKQQIAFRLAASEKNIVYMKRIQAFVSYCVKNKITTLPYYRTCDQVLSPNADPCSTWENIELWASDSGEIIEDILNRACNKTPIEEKISRRHSTIGIEYQINKTKETEETKKRLSLSLTDQKLDQPIVKKLENFAIREDHLRKSDCLTRGEIKTLVEQINKNYPLPQ